VRADVEGRLVVDAVTLACILLFGSDPSDFWTTRDMKQTGIPQPTHFTKMAQIVGEHHKPHNVVKPLEYILYLGQC
jgi:hypothetical protein